MDGAIAKATGGGKAAGRSPVDRGKQGMKSKPLIPPTSGPLKGGAFCEAVNSAVWPALGVSARRWRRRFGAWVRVAAESCGRGGRDGCRWNARSVHDVETGMTTDQRTITNSAVLHDPTPFGYSHAVSACGVPVFIGGQYASDTTGAPVPVISRTRWTWHSTDCGRRWRGSALGYEHVVRLGTFIVDHDLNKLEILGKALRARFGDRLPAQALSGLASLALPGMLFEVDAVAVRP